MKVLIASDIHGSVNATERLLENFKKEGAEHLFLLGDIYNHGPRNGIPESYDPIRVSELLNGITDKLTVIKGNCDSEVDTLISDFDFAESAYVFIGGKRIFLTHGHVYNMDNLPKNADAIVYGHFHTGFISEKDGMIVANTGSITFPKNGTPKSYISVTETKIILKTDEGEIIAEREI